MIEDERDYEDIIKSWKFPAWKIAYLKRILSFLDGQRGRLITNHEIAEGSGVPIERVREIITYVAGAGAICRWKAGQYRVTEKVIPQEETA
jgi:predicted transcriptional regulator of viral defense system